MLVLLVDALVSISPGAALAGQIHVRVATDLTDLEGLPETSNDWHGLSVVCWLTMA